MRWLFLSHFRSESHFWGSRGSIKNCLEPSLPSLTKLSLSKSLTYSLGLKLLMKLNGVFLAEHHSLIPFCLAHKVWWNWPHKSFSVFESVLGQFNGEKMTSVNCNEIQQKWFNGNNSFWTTNTRIDMWWEFKLNRERLFYHIILNLKNSLFMKF